MEGGKPTIVTNAEGGRTTPSVVAYTKTGERLVGQVRSPIHERASAPGDVIERLRGRARIGLLKSGRAAPALPDGDTAAHAPCSGTSLATRGRPLWRQLTSFGPDWRSAVDSCPPAGPRG